MMLKSPSKMAEAQTFMIEQDQNVHEMEEAMKKDEVCTLDGSVDWYGNPAVKGKSGGWIVGVLLLVNQGLATLALFGIGLNLVLFLTRVMQLDNAEAANQVSMWTGTTYICSILGAFLSDSYWGRYKSCVIFQLIFLSGLVEFTLSTSLLLSKNCVPGIGHPHCEPPTNLKILLFYLSLYQIAIGNGAYQPVIATFGADQFDEEDRDESVSKIAFFSYFYMANNLGTLFSITELAYLEDKGKWGFGFWISAGAAFLSVAFFFVGTMRYRHFMPGGNVLARITKVIVASLKKRKVSLPTGEKDLYEVDSQNDSKSGNRRILHTPDFRFLDKAAVITSRGSPLQGQSVTYPSSLCTISQVEEVKCILRLLPIWLCSIIYSVVYNQMSSIFVEQGTGMATSLSSFKIPPASMQIFEIIGVTVLILLYRLYIVPLSARLQTGKSKGFSELQRMGIGLVISAVAMVSAGVVELKRLKHANNTCETCRASSSLSILWQIPQYVLIGASEVFMYVGQLEFFYNQAPDGMKSFGSALFVASMSAGSYASSLLVAIVMNITGRGNEVGWISKNLNRGHLDRFYFLLAALTVIDLFIFVACAKKYRCVIYDRKGGVRDETGFVTDETE